MACVYSLNFEKKEEFSISALQKKNSWTDYVKGVIDQLIKAGHAVKGFNAVLEGNIPPGSGTEQLSRDRGRHSILSGSVE